MADEKGTEATGRVIEVNLPGGASFHLSGGAPSYSKVLRDAWIWHRGWLVSGLLLTFGAPLVSCWLPGWHGLLVSEFFAILTWNVGLRLGVLVREVHHY